MIKFADLQKIINRQACFNWSDEYKPSTLATRQEGSRISRISRLNSLLLGRALHLQSTTETLFAKFALYHPKLFDLHEQKMIFPVPHLHPLEGHPLAVGAHLPNIEGTITIARRIGLKHNQITAKMEDEKSKRIPFPYQGDLLLYLTNENGKPYAINWNLKVTPADFGEKNRSRVKTPMQQNESKKLQELRNELEEKYYASAGIRTLKLTPENLDKNLSANLDLMFSSHLKQFTVKDNILHDYSEALEEALIDGVPLALIALRYSKKWGNRDQFITKIYQDIWNRKLLINLFEPVRIDHALEPQTKDPLVFYENLFLEVCK